MQKIYNTLVPAHKYVVRIDSVVADIQGRLMMLERNAASQVLAYENRIALDKLFLASDDMIYRYLYLLRYMKDNCTVLDIEGEYGTGIDLLYRYTSADKCACLNSIDWYTRLGKMYYGREAVHYQTGSIYGIQEKYDVITVLHEERTALFGVEDLRRLYDMLEAEGILALALSASAPLQVNVEMLNTIGFKLEKQLYQMKGNPELLSVLSDNAVQLFYLRKHE